MYKYDQNFNKLPVVTMQASQPSHNRENFAFYGSNNSSNKKMPLWAWVLIILAIAAVIAIIVYFVRKYRHGTSTQPEKFGFRFN